MAATMYINKNEGVDCSVSGVEIIALLIKQFLDSSLFPKDNDSLYFLKELNIVAEQGSNIFGFDMIGKEAYNLAGKSLLKAKEYLETLPVSERNAWFESHDFIGAAYDNESPRCVKKILEQLAQKLVEDPRWGRANI